MKLNKKSIQKLRKIVQEELEIMPDDKRITLEREELELLIFDYIVIDGEKYKIPVWTGTFLRKLNLDYEGLFDDVYWSETDKIKRERIDLSYTNAIIRFRDNISSIYDCNFSGLDLSFSNIERVKTIKKVDLSYAKVPTIKEILRKGLYIGETKLCGIDLTDVEIQYEYYLYNDTDFSNTGIKLLCDKKDLTSSVETGKAVSESLQKGYFTNCYFNGKKILSLNEKKALAEARLLRYENFEKMEINSFVSNIRGKIKRLN